ncbi:hypothetical protein HNQ77_000785 [Silvibacterium bohemicum]|uniref:Uncharacterized protein n=1 Tax=Silvibacterium bohemicum TaxID=1577686 RepID=A0A841JQL9_9BACT|nr:hypothetical protein [Silvibacterium bohemicum]MBB6142847.1 hypothetical protein [Silvibacterium bohemicum]
MRQPAKNIPFDRDVALGRIGNISAREQSECICPASLISEDFSFEQAKAEGPIRVGDRENVSFLIGFFSCNVEVAAQEIAADILKDNGGIICRCSVTSEESFNA